ncbi:hypothetical protein N431DRAFT_393756 [Stipitochalara longipes BDJ]|nr:hypothetical protein N431DRAFT_393756 [Stipitochalara longipes BDJ]
MNHLENLQLGDLWKPRYYGNLFNSRQHDFHNFPNQIGWTLSNDTLEFETETDISFNKFLQSWLFFGLLSTILGKPAKTLSETLKSDAGFINTSRLNGYLEEWRADVAAQDTHSRSLRMIRAQVALDKARHIVTEYCSEDGKKVKPEGHPCHVHPYLGLSLMVLGETLTNAKSKIVEKVGFNIRGWHGDAMEGWGTPSCVLETMHREGWCRKLVEILRLQLRSHATSILAAYSSHFQTEARASYLIEGHKDCTEEKCKLRFVGTNGEYETQHQLTCRSHRRHPEHSKDDQSCKMMGPDIDQVVELIKNHRVPLLEYDKYSGKVDVVEHEPYMPYATISHVWSDGYGNPKDNMLWKCQLDFFDELFNEAHKESRSGERRLFWIDTLAIPIHEKDKDERRIAVRQIHQVYTNARYTVVIDKGLGQMLPADSYEGTAMRILASGWMRRLWTLQEAYLSRRLYFAFASPGDGEKRLKNLEDLEEMYPKASDILTSNIPSAARTYFHNLLGNDRRARINELPAGNGTDILASVWRAARWRTTNHQEHETLALATLLNLEYKNTKFQDAGLIKKAAKVEEDQLQGMMIDLWKLLDKTCPGSIPPGIIFLPGEKLKDPSFGWAPKTWMSNEELEYPDPLTNMVGAAKLVPEGLLVQYPGFVLHAQNRASILRVNESSFHFPSDSTLLEWYGVELTGLRNNPPKGNEKDEKQLAIILCRPKPKEIPEIALLVEIEEKIVQRSFSDKHHHSVIYHVSYDQRVKIWRETNGDLLSKWRDYITTSIDLDEKKVSGDPKREDNMICGEALDSDQRWYVGGRPLPDNIDVKPVEQEVKKVPAQKVTEPGHIPVDSGQSRTSKPVVRGVRKNTPFMMGGLGGPKSSSLRPNSVPSTRATPTAVAAAHHALAQTSEPLSVQHPDSTHTPMRGRNTRSRSTSAVSSNSTASQSTSTPQHRVGSSPSLAVQSPNTSPAGENEHSPLRGSGSRIPVAKAGGKAVNGGSAGSTTNGSAK